MTLPLLAVVIPTQGEIDFMLKGWIKRFLVADEIFVFKTASLLKLPNQHCSTYNTNAPYPHAVIDGFLPDLVAERLMAVFPKPGDSVWLDWRKRDILNQPRKQ